ncbi:MAG TPA: acyl-CoA dehydrogenase family protein [Thermoleophilaceae bacterium]|jgi:alkylation response protein AidB-like acyl-CoA dehydrogenase
MDVLGTERRPFAGSRFQAEVASLRLETRQRFQWFIQRRSNPAALECDRSITPVSRSLFREAAEIGLVQFSLPTAIGGEGRDKFEWGIVVEELARLARDPGFSTLLDISGEVAELLLRTGRSDLIERYVARLASGQAIATVAAYENRDPYDYASTARERPGGWVLDGKKGIVAAALIADFFVVFVRDEESNDLLGFLVARDDAGVAISGLETMGARSLGLGQIALCGVRLPDARLIWRADALSGMNSYARNRRLMTASTLVGTMDALVTRCVERMATRIRGGRPVLDYPNVERAVGEMRVAIETSRAIVHLALDATRGDRDPYFDELATAAKHHTAQTAVQVGQLVMSLQGGEGYMTLHPWERYMRDVLGLMAGQGAQELLLIQLGQRTAVEVDGRKLREGRVNQTIARLVAARHALRTLGTDLDGDGAASGAAGLREHATEVLAAAGLGEALQPRREALGDELCSILRAGSAFFGRAQRGELDGELVEVLTGRPEQFDEPLARLAGSASACAVLAAALATKLLDAIAMPRETAALSERVGAPEWVVEGMLEVLVGAGLVRRDAEEYAAAPGLESMLDDSAWRAAVEAELRSALAGAPGSLGGDGRPELAYDGTAFALCEALFERHLPDLEGLADLLRSGSRRVLVIGPGSAELAVELCRWLPDVRVVGLEREPSALSQGVADVRAAGLSERVEVDGRPVGDLPADAPFALALVPVAFHPRAVVERELAALRGAVEPNGWVLSALPVPPRDPLGAAVRRLRTARSGGDPHLGEAELERLLTGVGFPLTRVLPADARLGPRLVAARNLPARADGDGPGGGSG